MKVNLSGLFVAGFFGVLVITALLYGLLPETNLLRGYYSLYRPTESLPEVFESKASFTNIDLLLKVGSYVLGYWLLFAVMYLVINKRLRLNDRATKIHFFLSLIAFFFIVLLNQYIVFASISPHRSYLSDVFIDTDISLDEWMEFQKEIIVRAALLNFSSILGILLLLVGTIFFIRNVLKSSKEMEN